MSSFEFDESPLELDEILGFSFSYVKGIAISPKIPVFLETGVKIEYVTGNVLNVSGYNYDYDCYEKLKIKASMLSAIVPLDITYKISLNDKFSLMPYAGAFLKGNIWGESTTDVVLLGTSVSETDDMFDEDEGDGTRFQYGLRFGLAACYDNYVISLGYQTELNEVMESTDTSAWGVSIGYNF